MAEFDYGIDLEGNEQEVEEVDPGGEPEANAPEGVTGEEEPSEEESPDGGSDPWAWAADEDPEKVRKTWTRFTQELETVKERERRLEQEDRALDRYRAIAKEIESDPGLVQVIQDYMQKGGTPEAQLESMRQELVTLQTQVQVQRELNVLHKTVVEKGLPDFQDEDLVRHAVEINAPTMELAYKDMMFDAAQKKRVDKVVGGIKKSRGAVPPKSGREAGSVQQGFTVADISKMSEEEFLKNYDGIMKQADARGRRSI